jgi:hypothetical protein
LSESFVVGEGVRPRTDQGHVAGKHIEELGQLVEAGLSHESAKPGDSFVLFGRLSDRAAIIAACHRSKLVNEKRAPAISAASLSKEDWPWAFKLHYECDHRHKRPKRGDGRGGKYQVENALRSTAKRRFGMMFGLGSGRGRRMARSERREQRSVLISNRCASTICI